MTAQLAFAFDQRWQGRRQTLLFPGARIDPREFGVEVIPQSVAKPFILQHHYSGSYPAAHCAVGLFRRTGVGPSALVGVAVFSEGVQSHRAMPRYTGFGREAGTELGRLVLLPEVAFNGESWFIARAFDALRAEKPRLRAVLSYADPVERVSGSGQIIKPGHFGTIYQASNAAYLGRAEPRKLLLGADGRVVHPYNFNKVSEARQGSAAAERIILEAGCPARDPGETPAAWVERCKASLRPLRHPGNLVYAFGLDTAAWKQIRAGVTLPYPKAKLMKEAA